MKIFKIFQQTSKAFKIYEHSPKIYKIFVSGFADVTNIIITFRHYVKTTYSFVMNKLFKVDFKTAVKNQYKISSIKNTTAEFNTFVKTNYSISIGKQIGEVDFDSATKIEYGMTSSKVIPEYEISIFNIPEKVTAFVGRLRLFTDTPDVTLLEMENWSIRTFDYIEY